jgi:hypothetical protein
MKLPKILLLLTVVSVCTYAQGTAADYERSLMRVVMTTGWIRSGGMNNG